MNRGSSVGASSPLIVATVVIGVGMFGVVTILPFFAQMSARLGYVLVYLPTRIGLLIEPITAAMVSGCTADAAARQCARFARGVWC
ncbi:MAG: hypothetical protein M3306_25460 [Actinomycetota bacterium]|nr:hypothetical protein [Actinomycetota bacterium]